MIFNSFNCNILTFACTSTFIEDLKLSGGTLIEDLTLGGYGPAPFSSGTAYLVEFSMVKLTYLKIETELNFQYYLELNF